MGISILSHAEIQYGFAKKPKKTKMQRLFNQLLLRIEVLPFDETVSTHYGQFKANVEKQGKSLAPLDMLIAAHASAIDAILVSNDQAFQQIKDLHVQDWTQE
ncbi:type II toxin-antitoxin system VapC family toxin [Alysiella crassa]|uniref:tRNA(fMet)-specific endonuclease VapC n=1 Tax=Alysiella crassa TaxID=153491 RepID=A0A376BUN7_9NEIS|nr:type II toxin-antitoxin system VapC family toxin [Alysiella crassa]UOP06087.1 type II toxin-antitoxin system VapC family toxin [Alysiella crassa]SSY80551.1 tRNA(fMet)-specific endonuclease VapC [Alysiella crassa]